MKIVIFKNGTQFGWRRITADGKNLGTVDRGHSTKEDCLAHITEFFGLEETLPADATVINLPPISISISWQ